MERLDQYLIRVEELPSREFSREEVLKGQVLVNGKKVLKPGYKVKTKDQVDYLGQGRQYVSRGAEKLLGAIKSFAPIIKNQRCIDVGASTGGFTQVLLEAGAAFVAALDVGHGQLHQEIKTHPRVKSFEGINFRSLDEQLVQDLGAFDLLTMDVSFISVLLLKDSIKTVLKPEGAAIILIKPQFEAGRGALNKAGVVTDPGRHRNILTKVLSDFLEAGFRLGGLTPSSIQGPDGNIEYLAYLKNSPSDLGEEIDPNEQALNTQPQILEGDIGYPNPIKSLELLTEEIKANIIGVVETAFESFELPHHR